MSDAVGLNADLTLDISRALSSVDDLEERLNQATTGIVLDLDYLPSVEAFSDSLTEAVANLTSVPVSLDTSEIPADIETAAASVTPEVPVQADVGGMVDEIEQAVANAEVPPIDIQADTGDAEAQIEDLGNAAGDASGSVAGLGTATDALGVGAGVARGETAGLTASIAGISPGAAGAVAAISGVAATTGALFTNALAAQGSTFRLNEQLGVMADKATEINVGNLNVNLEQLAIQLGSSDEGMKDVISRMAQWGEASDQTVEKSEAVAEQFLALAGRAVALNPELGEVGDVADRMANVMASGRTRGLVPFGISLNATEIQARALQDTGKTSVTELNRFELAAAGASIATEQFGGHLKQDINEGAKNPILQVRSLKTAFDEATESIGQPLVSPIIDLLRESEPVAVDVARVIGELAKDAIPVLTAAVEILGPPLGLAASILDALPDPIVTTTIAVLGANVALGFLSEAIIGVEVSLGPLGIALAATALLLTQVSDLFGDSGPLDQDAQKGIDSAASSFDDLSKSVHDSIAEMIKGAEKSQLFTATLNEAGSTTEELNTALGFGGEAWSEYEKRIIAANGGIQDWTDVRGRAAKETLDHLKDATEQAAEATVNKAKADGLLTQAQIDEATSAAGQIDGKTNWAAALNALQPSIDAVTVGTDGLTGAQEKEKEAQDKAAKAAKDHADAIDHLEQVMKDVLDGTFSVFEAELKLSNARIDAKKRIDDYAKANADGTKTQDELTSSLNDARQAVLDQAQANVDLREAQNKANGITETATQKQQAYVTELQSVADTLDPSNPLRVALDSYIWTLASTPTDKHTDFQVEVDDALRKWQEYVDSLINGTPYEIETIFNVRTGGPRAAGGPVEAGVAYPVGEQGMELFVPRVPGVIIPHGPTESIIGANGNHGSTRSAPLVYIGSQTFVTPDPVMAGRENARQLRQITTSRTR